MIELEHGGIRLAAVRTVAVGCILIDEPAGFLPAPGPG
jgi:hypothetical protein